MLICAEVLLPHDPGPLIKMATLHMCTLFLCFQQAVYSPVGRCVLQSVMYKIMLAPGGKCNFWQLSSHKVETDHGGWVYKIISKPLTAGNSP